MSTRARWSVACAFFAALVATTGVLLPCTMSSGQAFTGTAIVRPDTAWDEQFPSYGDMSGAWSGGDGAQSVLLPDGNTVWFFADTYLGTPGPGGMRSPFETGSADCTWVTPPRPYSPDRDDLINGDQVLDDGTIYKFFQLAERGIHPGGFEYKLVGTVGESFRVSYGSPDAIAPAGGTPVGIEDTAGSDPIIWGAATLVSGGYIYGVKPYNSSAAPYPLYLARVPVGDLADGDAWQYYDARPGCPASSAGWTSDARSAAVVRTGVSAGFSVTDVNGTYVLLTGDGSSARTASDAMAYYASCPTGFSLDSPRYLVDQPRLPSGWLAYEYRIVPQFSSGSDVLVSYSMNTLSTAENLSNVTIYRPRFLDVRLPGIGGPSGPVTDPRTAA